MYRCRFFLAALVFFAALFFTSPAAFANNYGSGSYDSCSYAECPVAEPASLPNGLKVIINLTNNMIVPRDSFIITITQLSGAESVTLKSATIWIDGKEIETVTPDTTGTARWKWDVKKYPGTKVRVIVTASDDTTSTFEYTVQHSPPDVPKDDDLVTGGKTTTGGKSAGPAPTAESDTGVVATLLKAVVPEGVKQVFRSLSPVAINSFPYFLFVALGIVAVVLLLQIKRELRASHRLKKAIEKEKLMIELKRNFIGLASHYLRTPVTLITGSIDLAGTTKTLSEEVLGPLRTASDKLSEHVKSIIASEETPLPEPDQQQQTNGHIRIGIALAILGVALVFGLFTVLAFASGRAIPAANFIAQIMIFIAIGLALYQIERRFTLRRLERKAEDDVLALQQQLQDGQDVFLERTATQLYEDYNAIHDLSSALPSDENTKMLHEGVSRLERVVSKCRTAQSLKGSRSQQQFTPTNVKNLFEYDDDKLSQQIHDKNIQVVEPQDAQLGLQEPSLIRYVTRSLVDNAVAYSPENSTVTLAARPEGAALSLAIADKGKGISKDRRELLFQPLSKIEGYENFDHEGMGFSLYLDKLIMEYLGGNIDIQSEEDQGTTVNLRIPAAQAS